jgi:excisionase family DNA binding protein
MLTSTQVCERLGISRNTLRKYIDRGYLTAIKTGDEPNAPLRISEESLREFIESRTVKPAAS